MERYKKEMNRILGITTMERMGTYLGLPESLGGAKSKILPLFGRGFKTVSMVGHQMFCQNGVKKSLQNMCQWQCQLTLCHVLGYLNWSLVSLPVQ